MTFADRVRSSGTVNLDLDEPERTDPLAHRRRGSYAAGPAARRTTRRRASRRRRRLVVQHIRGGGPDVNPELTGSQKFDVYDEMAKTDASIKALQMFWSLPVKARRLGDEPESAADGLSEPDALAVAIRDASTRSSGSSSATTPGSTCRGRSCSRRAEAAADDGPCIEELVWDDVRTWVDADGDST
jgi:hypothetical protein